MNGPLISDREFQCFQQFIHEAAGITLSDSKKALVGGRLATRITACGVATYGEYFRLLTSGRAPAEVQRAIDLLTTNETYFFREQKHFDFLHAQALDARNRSQPFRVWSAASSSGEEAYSMAMVLADCLGNDNWEVVASDISTRVLEKAKVGHYPMERARHIPPPYLKRFCLKGIESQEGTMLIDRPLRDKVLFLQINLNAALPSLGNFDIIFLRNVMIYFSADTKRQVAGRVLSLLKSDGYFCVGHSENLNDIGGAVKQYAPSIYAKR